MSRNILEFKKECKKYVCPSGTQPNYRIMPNGMESGMNLFVPFDKQEDFLNIYYKLKVEPKIKSTLLEIPHPDHNQIKIDLDFVFKLENDEDAKNLTHSYDLKLVKELL